MSSYRQSPPRTTSIENFMDLEDILSDKPSINNGVMISSLDGYPGPQHVNKNFMDQMDSETSERMSQMKPVMQNRVRNHDPQQVSIAMNGGYPPSTIEHFVDIPQEQYQLGPKAVQNLRENYVSSSPSPTQRASERSERIPEYPPYPQQADRPSNAAQYSNYSVENYSRHPYRISCLEIAEHVQKCPICSRFYDNDRSMYWVAIFLLGILCVYLLKKLIEGKR